jgi:hypothetical protein
MTWRPASCIVLVSVLSALSAQEQTGTSVKSATVSVIRKAVDVQFIEVENLREVPLVEIKLALNSSTAGFFFDGPPDVTGQPSNPAIRRHEIRRLRTLRGAYNRAPTARVTLALFADGSHLGTPEAIAEFRQRQQLIIDDLSFWFGVLQKVPRSTPAAAHEYLREKAKERLRVDRTDPSRIAGSIDDWFGPYRAPDWWMAGAKREIVDLGKRLDVARRYRNFVNTDTGGVEQAVGIRSEIGQGSDFVAVITNLRELPLEAWEVDLQHPTSGIAGSWLTHDACASLSDTASSGRLRQHETREVLINSADDLPDSAMPRASLALALWNDLSWEGLPDRRANLLRAREERAKAYEFWINALKEAGLRPVAEVLPFLKQQQAARRREAPREQSGLDQNLDSLAGRDPNVAVNWLAGYRRTLEQQYLLLTRHVARQ